VKNIRNYQFEHIIVTIIIIIIIIVVVVVGCSYYYFCKHGVVDLSIIDYSITRNRNFSMKPYMSKEDMDIYKHCLL
jgi:hypothetical protein